MEQAHQQSYNTSILLDTYIQSLLHIEPPQDQKFYKTTLRKIQKKYDDIFTLRIKLDENTEYLHLVLSGRVYESASIKKDANKLFIEDRNRFYTTLKNITYYNKRYLFPI